MRTLAVHVEAFASPPFEFSLSRLSPAVCRKPKNPSAGPRAVACNVACDLETDNLLPASLLDLSKFESLPAARRVQLAGAAALPPRGR